jgi:hypothetical protein
MPTPEVRHPTTITLPPEQTRDLIILLIDVHGLLDHLHLDGADPELTAAADSYLHYTTTNHHTLPTIIDALDNLISQLTHTMREAVLHTGFAHRAHPTNP